MVEHLCVAIVNGRQTNIVFLGHDKNPHNNRTDDHEQAQNQSPSITSRGRGRRGPGVLGLDLHGHLVVALTLFLSNPKSIDLNCYNIS